MAYLSLPRECLLLVFFIAIVNSELLVLSPKESSHVPDVNEKDIPDASSTPEIYEMLIGTNVTNRFAKTLITSKVRNSGSVAKEAVFFVVLPEKAFISEFVMEIGGKSYKAYVKEKEEAKDIYDKAVSSGQSAAHVAVSARDSNKFTVSLNIEPESKAVFKLTYEELLQRQKGRYEIVLNIHPGQIVPKLEVEVLIDETAPLSFVRTPLLRSGNEIDKNGDDLKPNAEIIKINSTSSIVKFHPDVSSQKLFAKALDTKESEGFKGQFVVEYDVERSANGGEVLLNDGYFVHFFAPENIENLPKQVVFVLDLSGSMMGRNMEQLIDAMVHILNDLKSIDTFSIVGFNTNVEVWNIDTGDFVTLNLGYTSNYGNLETLLREKQIPKPIVATSENIEKAKKFVKTMRATSLTNIIGGLEVGLFIVKMAQENASEFHQPLVVFLTDGQANVGISDSNNIINTVAKLNPEEKQTPIFSLSFGNGADKNFLRKLSARNLGFSRHIYEGGDASLQLQDFYQLISSPLMKDVNFKYTKDANVTTKNHFPIFFGGNEFIVAGRIPIDAKNEYIVEAWRPGGRIPLKPKVIEPVESLERLWAFLTVRQILDEREVSDKKSELTKKAVDLALKYSFVTPVTSLVVVKPNDTSAVDTEDASKISRPDSFLGRLPLPPSSGYPYPQYSLPQRGLPTYYFDAGAPTRSFNYMSLPSSNIPSPYVPFKGFGAPTSYNVVHSLRVPPGYPNLNGYGAPASFDSMPSIRVPSGYPSFNGFGAPASFDSMPSIRVPSGYPSFNGRPGFQFTLPTYRPISTTMVTTSTSSSQASPVPLPQLQNQEWFKSIMNDMFSIKIGQDYKLATNETLVAKQPCTMTVSNKLGQCTLIHECPEALPHLTDLSVFKKYFCPLEGYAGICCDILAPA